MGVGSGVSAVASQLYKKFLQRSADKLKEIHPGETLAMGSKGSAGSKDGASAGGGAGAAVGAGSVAGSHAAATAKLDAAETTALPKEAPRGRTPHADASLAGGTVVQRARAERQRKKKFKRGVVIVSIVSALLAVAVSAFVIDFVSAGQGVGAKTEPILPSRSQPADDAPAASNGKDDSTGSSSPEESDASKDGAKDQGESQSDGKGSSGSARSGTDSGSNSRSSSGDRGSSNSGSGSVDGLERLFRIERLVGRRQRFGRRERQPVGFGRRIERQFRQRLRQHGRADGSSGAPARPRVRDGRLCRSGAAGGESACGFRRVLASRRGVY
ncbi:MAG: hypothetical protein ACLSVD_07610 [Eggerthellaceae bacterium]